MLFVYIETSYLNIIICLDSVYLNKNNIKENNKNHLKKLCLIDRSNGKIEVERHRYRTICASNGFGFRTRYRCRYPNVDSQ